MTELVPVLGVLAGVVGVADTIPYVRDTLHGSTRPHRGTWLIWGVLAMVAFLSQRADGASWSLVMIGTQAVLTSVIFVLAIRFGEGGVTAPELVMITIAGAGVLGWIVVDEPLVATACVIVADLVGTAMMVPKTYRDPGSETFVTYALASVGGALGTGAVGAVDLSLLAYPAYYCLANGAIAVLIHRRRRALAGAGATGATADDLAGRAAAPARRPSTGDDGRRGGEGSTTFVPSRPAAHESRGAGRGRRGRPRARRRGTSV